MNLSEIKEQKKTRIEFIELCLAFLGRLQRKHLTNRFGVKLVTATDDIATYKSLCPNNIRFNQKLKQYEPAKCFKPLFKYDPEQVLQLITYGRQYETCFHWSYTIPSQSYSKELINLLDVCGVTQALSQGRLCEIDYLSSSNHSLNRRIAPHAIFQVGQSWYIRAYSFSDDEFRTFKLNRILRSKLHREITSPRNRADKDNDWNENISINLIANQHSKNPLSIEFDYGLDCIDEHGKKYKSFQIKKCMELMFYKLYCVMPKEICSLISRGQCDREMKAQIALLFPLEIKK